MKMHVSNCRPFCPLLNQGKPQVGCHVWAGAQICGGRSCSVKKTLQGQSGSSCVHVPTPPSRGLAPSHTACHFTPPTALGLEPQRLGGGPRKRRDPLHAGATNWKLGLQPQSVHPSPCDLRHPRACPTGSPCPLRPQS